MGRGFGKNAGEWTGRVEISKEDLPGSKRNMYGHHGNHNIFFTGGFLLFPP